VNLQQKIILILGVSMLTPLLLRALENIWYLAIDTQDVYFIPEGSSIFTFRMTEANPGSGDWWIYGEDNRYYYYFEHGRKISKQAAKSCRNFVKTDLQTWCKNK
jgi:hypothetical protein